MSHRLHLFKSKIHRATVTHADLDYEGSVTISGELMDAAGMLEHEQVHIWNVTRGTRLVTYTLRGEDGSGIICINGAAAHLMSPGDKVDPRDVRRGRRRGCEGVEADGRVRRRQEPDGRGGRRDRGPEAPAHCLADSIHKGTITPSPPATAMSLRRSSICPRPAIE